MKQEDDPIRLVRMVKQIVGYRANTPTPDPIRLVRMVKQIVG